MNGKIVRQAFLVAGNSPRQAFYRLQVVDIGVGFVIKKESGAAGKILDTEFWYRRSEKFEPVPEPYLKMRASRTQRSMIPPSLTRSSLID